MNEKQRERHAIGPNQKKSMDRRARKREKEKERREDERTKKMGRARERDRQIHTNVMYVE